MSRVVVARAYGGPEVLELVDREPGDPGPGEVLLAVGAAGVNPVDWKIYGGMMGADEAKLPRRVGSEAAGTVLAVGDDAVGPAGPIAVGDEVIAFRASGTYSERLVLPAARSCRGPRR